MALPVNINELINGRTVETDDERSYFASILSAHPQARLKAKKGEQVEAQVEARLEITQSQYKILSQC